MKKPLNPLGSSLKQRLVADGVKKNEPEDQLINVANVGKVVTLAYEQLRNAAEYTQEHLLRQRAIRRFLVRNLSFHTKQKPDGSLAEELIIELTQAGYIDNDSLPVSVLPKLDTLIKKHYNNHWRMEPTAGRATSEEWTLDLMSVGVENLIANDQKLKIYLYFAYEHYKDAVDKKRYASNDKDTNFDVSLYIAVHRALLKSDLANVRYDLQQLYKYSDKDATAYATFHKNISTAFTSDLTNTLARFVDKHGAPLRILKSMIEENRDLPKLLDNSDHFLSAFQAQVSHEYQSASKRLNAVLIKSIVFLLITKTLLGLMVEIPYDLAVTGTILIVPLLINLFAPIVYLLILRLGIKLPGQANTNALTKYIESALYADKNQVRLYTKERESSYTAGFTIAYALMFIAAFGITLDRLLALEFNILQIVLFFTFLATASFLGFRLTHIIRELELVTAKAGVIHAIRDFLYMPFIVLGRWLSEEYKKVNLVALILDTAVELPLKTLLRLIRQWTNFISDKKDAL